MSETITAKMARWAADLKFEQIGDKAVHEARRYLLACLRLSTRLPTLSVDKPQAEKIPLKAGLFWGSCRRHQRTGRIAPDVRGPVPENS